MSASPSDRLKAGDKSCVTIRRNCAYKKLFLIIARPYSLPTIDRHIVKLHRNLSPFTRLDLHVVKLQPRLNST
jgi:hypothetical protein